MTGTFLVLYFLLVFVASTVGSAYFAATVDQELRPFFEGHGMEPEASDARQAFGYLVASAVLGGLSVIRAIWKLCNPSPRSDDDDDKRQGLCSTLISLACSIVLLAFAILTIQHSWGWWKHFDAEGNGHLAAASQGLAVFLISMMVISVFGSIVAIVVGISSKG
ncbi:hypothetical protein F4821DRAFT_279033 [Hypoxylon rubiginosum]|uniref:Uncharacterized protein n=1 Tax=Hypoxylon rubiginosum TaxID=110542 RepID=A0ACC0CZI7_9PEZI|nr:hypothetical protein F4821DRAFT_279033 [Hypoxylon rubiginosum]